MNGRILRAAASILALALALTASCACGRKAKPEPLRGAALSGRTHISADSR